VVEFVRGGGGTGTFVITVDSATDPRTSVILGYASRDTSLQQWLKVQRVVLSVISLRSQCLVYSAPNCGIT
jgi:hypothetical protein